MPNLDNTNSQDELRYRCYLCFYDFVIGFWKISDGVVYFLEFHFIVLNMD